jgi:tRNA 2-thiouridine synthesizing protein A
MTAEPVVRIDATGQLCPLPVIELARRIKDVEIGGVIEILADDPAAATDFPAWCRMRDQEYIESIPADAATVYRIRRLR